ncbi:MAG: ATP synthase F1 subunit delta [Candidatus Sumerlaeia bacterium]|nr:ATP synthase F1 subunit delta [Candidatus Sumerlaeia bacterium]
MKKEHLIAQIYGDSLFQAAKAAGEVIPIMMDVQQLCRAFEVQPRFLAFLEAPHIPSESKMALAEKVLMNGVHRLLRNLILLMLRKNRIELLVPALDHFELLAEKDQGLIRGIVTSAVELSEVEKKQILASLEVYTKSKITARYKVDPTLIGGVTFKAGDLFIDNSIKTSLNKLKTQLNAAFTR